MKKISILLAIFHFSTFLALLGLSVGAGYLFFRLGKNDPTIFSEHWRVWLFIGVSSAWSLLSLVMGIIHVIYATRLHKRVLPKIIDTKTQKLLHKNEAELSSLKAKLHQEAFDYYNKNS